MRRMRTIAVQLAIASWAMGAAAPVPAAVISNSASGSVNGQPLEEAAAVVTLERIGAVATSALAEISPNSVLANGPATALLYDVLPTISAGDAGITRVEISVPAGYANITATSVTVGGATLSANCPSPAGGQYCAIVAGSLLTVVLGDRVDVSQTHIRIGFTTDTPAVPGSADFTSVVADASSTLATVPGDADADPADANSINVAVSQSQGDVLRLIKTANKRDAYVGEVVTYNVAIRNLSASDVVQTRIEDTIPPGFKYVRNSARLDGAPLADPSGTRPLVFDIGTVPGLVDGNGNGTADPGEPGYRSLVYQLVIGSGVRPGSYPNTAVARDFCATCEISDRTSASVEVRIDREFDLGTIIGKVFHDLNRDGWQDPGELGVAQAMVALDDGTYALTDEYGRYHFPAVRPGQRLVKLNRHSLPPGAVIVSDPTPVLSLTPGLMARANFGVLLDGETETIGSNGATGVELSASPSVLPLDLRGSAEGPALLVNGVPIALPSTDVHLGRDALDETVRLLGGSLEAPVRFEFETEPGAGIAAWRLALFDRHGAPVRALEGRGAPPPSVEWDGRVDGGALLSAGEVYQYQLEVSYEDGARSASPRHLLGVNRTSVIALDLRGEAFTSGKATLSPRAQQAMREVAQALRAHPDEKVVIEGHTDAVGTAEANLDLSRRRAQAAADYLISDLGLPAEQFVLRWFGEERPLASNLLDQGRELNRRVEIRGELADVQEAEILEAYRATPRVRVGGQTLPTGEHGRFAVRLDPGDSARLEVEMSSAGGRAAQTTVVLPRLAILAPQGRISVPLDGSVLGCSASSGDRAPVVSCRLDGRTDPGNVVELDGRALEVLADGAFGADLELAPGRSMWGLVARNAAGLTRLANLEIQVSDRDAAGARLVVGQIVPRLALTLPPREAKLSSMHFPLAGTTEPGNHVEVNGQPVTVGPDGRFAHTAELPRGKSRLVVRVVDPAGNAGSIERDVEVSKHELFLLAFADGRVGLLSGRGDLKAAGLSEADELFVEGRLAYYLKGTIAGKYLITSAFDSGSAELEPLFGDLDTEENRRLLTHLDPDRSYSVYGDSSTVVYDADRPGKFYLALDSDTIGLIVGSYPLSLSNTELAAYRRTLEGGRFTYRSASRTAFGDPDTEVTAFGADVRQAHVRDELRTTGGSLYYLSQREVIEGSEEVTLTVRDKNTDLVLSRQRQQRDVDYTIKYEEGRLMFNRPLSGVAPGGTLFDSDPLTGNAVYLEVDYETRLEHFEKTAAGARVRQQLGDRVAVGGTYVQDEVQSGSYDLGALDAELRVGQHSRINAEFAESEGSNALVFESDNGGLTYTPAAAAGSIKGSAWKFAADLDVGEWFARPERYRVKLYAKELEPGFSASGNAREQGTRKTGVLGEFALGERDTLQFRHEREEFTGVSETRLSAAQWRHERKRWGIAAEFLDRVTEDAAGMTFQESRTASTRLWSKLTEKLRAELEHQQTLDGEDLDRTGVALQFQALRSLALELRANDGDRGSAAQAGAVLDVGQSSIYVNQRLSDDPTGSQTSTVVGSRTALGPGSQAYSEYQLESTPSGGSAAVSLLGLQRQWDLAPGFRFRLGGETSDRSASTATRRSTLTTLLSYANADRWSVSTRNELRTEDGSPDRIQLLSYSQVDLRLDPNFTLLGRYRYGKTTDETADTTEARLEERSLGLAFRPTHNDRFNSLARYTLLSDLRPSFTTGELRTDREMQVISVESLFQVTRRIEWFAKAAARTQTEQVDDLPAVESETLLAIQRLNWRLWKPIELGLEYRVLEQQLADDRRQGWLGELSWRLMPRLRLGLGYNFTDFSDNEFSQNDYSVRGWFLRVQGTY